MVTTRGPRGRGERRKTAQASRELTKSLSAPPSSSKKEAKKTPLPADAEKVRVWWPPTDNKAKSDFSGMYWPAKVVKPPGGALKKYEVEYDNKERERVDPENVVPFTQLVEHGKESSNLAVGEFCEVSNNSTKDPAEWVAIVKSVNSSKSKYTVSYPFHDSDDDTVPFECVRRARVFDEEEEEWCLLRPGQTWKDGDITAPWELESFTTDELEAFLKAGGADAGVKAANAVKKKAEKAAAKEAEKAAAKEEEEEEEEDEEEEEEEEEKEKKEETKKNKQPKGKKAKAEAEKAEAKVPEAPAGAPVPFVPMPADPTMPVMMMPGMVPLPPGFAMAAAAAAAAGTAEEGNPKKRKKEKTKEEKKEKKQRKKDRNAPKKPKSAYLVFLDRNREEVCKENPTLSMKEVMPLLAAKWKKVSDAELKSCQEDATKEMEKYVSAMEKYNKEQEKLQQQLAMAAAAQFVVPQGLLPPGVAGGPPVQHLQLAPGAHLHFPSFVPAGPPGAPPQPAPDGKPKKDPNAPKKAHSAYICFSKAYHRQQKALQALAVSNGEQGEAINFEGMSKKIGDAWRALNRSERQVYFDLAKQEEERFNLEMKEYTEEKAKKQAAMAPMMQPPFHGGLPQGAMPPPRHRFPRPTHDAPARHGAARGRRRHDAAEAMEYVCKQHHRRGTCRGGWGPFAASFLDSVRCVLGTAGRPGC